LSPDPAAARPDLPDRVAHSWDELHEVVAALDDPQLAAPGPDGWSVKDHLVHLARWEEYLLARLDGRDGIAEWGLDPSREWDADSVNAVLQPRDAGVSPAAARARLAGTHARVLERLRTLDQADLERQLPLIEGNTCGHYDEHREWIRALATAVG